MLSQAHVMSCRAPGRDWEGLGFGALLLLSAIGMAVWPHCHASSLPHHLTILQLQ